MMEKLQTGAVPGADVMLTSGVYATIESIDEADENRVTVSSGTSTLVIHRSAIANILTPVEEDNFEQQNTLAPDDDPNFDGSINPSDDSSDSDEEDRDPKQS